MGIGIVPLRRICFIDAYNLNTHLMEVAMSYLTPNRLVVLIAGLALSANASSMHHGKGLKPPINLAQLEEQANVRFDEADLDGDGLLSKTEFAAADLPMQPARSGWRGKGKKQRKKHADATPEEREAQLEKMQDRLAKANPEQAAQREQMRAAMEAELFKLMDTDDDGQVDPEELSQADKRTLRHQAQKAAAFVVFDSNDDGLLSRDEIPNPAERLGQLDRNNDGTVSRREMRKGMAALRKARN